jgi:SAM-dependent methyltransferase
MVPQADVAAEDERGAYWSAFLYQRLHADVMLHALRASGFAQTPGGPILLVDIGCGAGTAGIAVAELLGQSGAADRISYVGWDHSVTMRRLALAMLNEPGVLPPGSRVECQRTLSEAIAAAVAHVDKTAVTLATFSYFFRQGAVTAGVAKDVAYRLGPLVRARTPVRAMVTDATGGAHRDWYPAFTETAQRYYAVEEWQPGASVDGHPRTIRYDLRYPYLYPGEGQFRVRKTRDPTALYRFLHLSPRTP